MSVIAKMNVSNVRDFPDGQKLELSCVCDDKLMAHYHPENENVVFTQYSPWGEAKMQIADPLTWASREEVYLIFTEGKLGVPSDAAIAGPIRVVSMTDFGGTSKQVEFASLDHAGYGRKPEPGEFSLFNMKMAIDNPGASGQFKPGEGDWTLLIYRASQMSMDEALAHAHSLVH